MGSKFNFWDAYLHVEGADYSMVDSYFHSNDYEDLVTLDFSPLSQ